MNTENVTPLVIVGDVNQEKSWKQTKRMQIFVYLCQCLTVGRGTRIQHPTTGKLNQLPSTSHLVLLFTGDEGMELPGRRQSSLGVQFKCFTFYIRSDQKSNHSDKANKTMWYYRWRWCGDITFLSMDDGIWICGGVLHVEGWIPGLCKGNGWEQQWSCKSIVFVMQNAIVGIYINVKAFFCHIKIRLHDK